MLLEYIILFSFFYKFLHGLFLATTSRSDNAKVHAASSSRGSFSLAASENWTEDVLIRDFSGSVSNVNYMSGGLPPAPRSSNETHENIHQQLVPCLACYIGFTPLHILTCWSGS